MSDLLFRVAEPTVEEYNSAWRPGLVSDRAVIAPRSVINLGEGGMGSKGRLVIVSNRLPSVKVPSNDDERRELPVGGLVSAVRAGMEERGGLWVGWSGQYAERVDANAPSVVSVGRIQLAAVDLPRNDVNLFYNLFSNRTLWPLLHSFPAKNDHSA